MTNITILDGGMGRELERMNAPFHQPEWSALALIEAPEKVTEAHLNFINAGAEVITTNTYAVVPFHIGDDMFSEKGHALIQTAANCAKDAVTKSGKDIKIAGCIPPLFGSYKPELFDEERYLEILTPQIEGQESIVDFWLIETISSIQEVVLVCKTLKKMSDKPIWLSFCPDSSTGNLRSGETIDDICNIVSLLSPDAVLFNCLQAEAVSSCIMTTIQKFGGTVPVGAYANAFAVPTGHQAANSSVTPLRDDLTPDCYLKFAKDWIDQGATIIGGCCGIMPEHIAVIASEVKSSR